MIVGDFPFVTVAKLRLEYFVFLVMYGISVFFVLLNLFLKKLSCRRDGFAIPTTGEFLVPKSAGVRRFPPPYLHLQALIFFQARQGAENEKLRQLIIKGMPELGADDESEQMVL